MNYLYFKDQELKTLVWIAEYGPLSRTDLSKMTGIKKQNLVKIVDGLLSRGYLKEQKPQEPLQSSFSALTSYRRSAKSAYEKKLPPHGLENIKVIKEQIIQRDRTKKIERKATGRGRPPKPLELGSPEVLCDICEELKHRLKRYESKLEELDTFLNKKMWFKIFELCYEEALNEKDISNEEEILFNEYFESLKKRNSFDAYNPHDISYSFVKLWHHKLQPIADKIPKPKVQSYGQMDTAENA